MRNTVEAALRDLLRAHQRSTADLRAARVTERNPDGTERLQGLDTDCIETGPVDSHAIGEIVLLPGRDPIHDTGVAGIPGVVHATSLAMWVESQEPRLLQRGVTSEVTITGQGFRSGMGFRYLRRNASPHPGVRVLSAEYIDQETYELVVAVDVEAEIVSGAPIAFGPSPGETRMRRDDFYDLSPPAEWYTGLSIDGTVLYGGLYGADGTLLRETYPIDVQGPLSDPFLEIRSVSAAPSLEAPGAVLLVLRSGYEEPPFDFPDLTFMLWSGEGGSSYFQPHSPGDDDCTQPFVVAGSIWYLVYPLSGLGPIELRRFPLIDRPTFPYVASTLVPTVEIESPGRAFATATDLWARQTDGKYVRFPLSGETPTEGEAPTFLGADEGHGANVPVGQGVGLIWNTALNRATQFVGVEEFALWPNTWSYPDESIRVHATPQGTHVVAYPADGSSGLLRVPWGATGEPPPLVILEALTEPPTEKTPIWVVSHY